MRPTYTLSAVCCWMAVATAVAAPPAGFEEPPTLSAREVVPADLLQGPHHRLADAVANDGYLNTFTLESDFGTFEARGEDLLRERVREVPALTALAEVTRSEAFAKSLAGAAMKPVETAANVVTNPVETVKGLPSGVGRYFKRTARKVKKTAKKVDEELSEDKDEQAEEGREAEETEGTAAEAGDEGGQGTMAKTKEVATDTSKRFLGVNSTKREWARKLGIDPYSSNEVLRRELDRVASLASVGSFAVRQVTPGVGALDYLGEVNELVWTMTATDLEVLNLGRLKQMGVDKAAREAYVANRTWSPSRFTGLVAALHGLEGVPGRAALMALADKASSEEETFFFQRSAEMLRVYHREAERVREIVTGEVWGGGIAAGGTFVMALALDHLAWTEDAAAAFSAASERYRAEPGVERLELRLAGRASPRARQELEARGWKVEEKVRERWLAPAEG